MNSKQKTFLATTALEEFWDTSQTMLFLGEWCKPYNNKSSWENLDAEVLTDETLDNSHSLEAYHYTIRIFEKLLPTLANWLNQIHGVRYSLRYWQITIGPFLLWYVQVVYQRLSYLKVAYSLYPNLNTIGLASSSYMAPINTREFFMFASESDAWNLQLFTQLLSSEFKISMPYQEYSWDFELEQRKKNFGNPIKYKPLTKMKLNLIRLLSRLRSKNLVGLCYCAHEFSKKNLYRLIVSSKFNILPLTQYEGSEQIALRKNKSDISVREEIAKLSSEDDFSRVVLNTLKINMPLNFIENYKEECELSEKCFPYYPRVIVSTSWMQSDLLKLWGAKRVEQGAKLVNIQHGGGYGAVKYCSYEFLERKNSDKFISWGWKEDEKVISAPSIFVCETRSIRKQNLKHEQRNLILWAATEYDRYLPYMACYLGHTKQSYFDQQLRFVNSLVPKVLSQITMRLRPSSRHFAYLKEYLSTLKIYLPTDKSSFFEQLNASKILISDNCNTTFLYALAFNIPTIVFFDDKVWGIREEANPCFEALKHVGICHDSPESAAAMLNKIADNPWEWWSRKDVQIARESFCNKFSRVSSNWIDEWSSLLLGCRK